MKLTHWIQREFRRLFPAFLYFLAMFYLLNVMEGLLLKTATIGPFSSLQVLLAAAVIAKILLVVDHLPLMDRLSQGRLIYIVIGKTLFYEAITIVVRLAIRFSPFLWSDQDLRAAYEDFLSHFDVSYFIAIQSWYLFVFFIFVTGRELIQAIGPQRMLDLFFRKKHL